MKEGKSPPALAPFEVIDIWDQRSERTSPGPSEIALECCSNHENLLELACLPRRHSWTINESAVC